MTGEHPLNLGYTPLVTPAQTKERWIAAALLAILSLIAFLYIALKSEPTIFEKDPPELLLDFIAIQKPAVVPPAPKPVVQKKVIEKTIEKVIETPSPVEIEPDDIATESADIATTEKVVESTAAPAKASPAYATVQDAAILDNSNYEPLFNPKPTYPAIALKNNIEGYVDLLLYIDEKGKIERFSIDKSVGHPSFGNAVAAVIPKWRFPPPRIKGEKVRIAYHYRLNFTLHN